jgi:formylmethanofuran dehydrogenase subunit E
MRSFDELLEESVRFHGHRCAGQVLGVRMAMLGCRLLGIEEPVTARRLIVYVEIDRCAADAIASVTGCRLGKRTLKHVDYGKMAATFVDQHTGRAVRITAREQARELARRYAPDVADRRSAQMQAYRVMPDEELFTVQEVELAIAETDLPGAPRARVTCAVCGEGVNDGREVRQDERVLCRACAHGAYYRVLPQGSPHVHKLEGAALLSVVTTPAC